MIKWGLLLSILVTVGCAPRIVLYLNNQSKFYQFNSYVLIGLKGQHMKNVQDDEQILPRIENAIREEMSRRSYTEDTNDPDLIIRYEIVSSQEFQRPSNTYPYSMTAIPFYSYRSVIESVLLIEIVTVSNQKLVWQASIDLKDHSKTTKRKDVLKSAVEKLYDTYLYRAGQKAPDPDLKITS